MYQQLSLFSTISNADLKINLHSLSTITGMAPMTVFNHNIICVPKNPFRPKLKAGEVNQIEQYRVTLTADLEKEAALKRIPHKFESSLETLRLLAWTLNVFEVPEAAKSKVITQGQLTSTVTKGDPFLFIDKLGYQYSSEYWTQGYQFVLGDIVILIFRVLDASDTNTPSHTDSSKPTPPVSPDNPVDGISSGLAAGGDSFSEVMVLDDDDNDDNSRPTLSVSSPTGPREAQFKLLDASGKWVVKAYVNVANLTDLDGLAEGRKALEKFQQDMSGLFELELPQRRSLDTRVRNR